MRKPLHDSAIIFRAPAWVVDAAEQKARSQGMNLSELMRQALRREVLGAS